MFVGNTAKKYISKQQRQINQNVYIKEPIQLIKDVYIATIYDNIIILN